MVQMLKTIDDRQQNNGDWNSQVYIEQKEAGKSDLVYQANIYRQDDKDTLVILFVKPAAEAGKGYLRVDKNLFFYDPASGKWERRTERERIGGRPMSARRSWAITRSTGSSSPPRPRRTWPTRSSSCGWTRRQETS